MGGYSGNVKRVARAGGFSLLELMVTLAVAAILLVIAVPSYRGIVQRNSAAANVNDLIGDLNYARSEAVTRGQPVFICSSDNQEKCSNDGDWGAGWIVFYLPTDPAAGSGSNVGAILRVRGARGNGFSLSSKDSNPLGFDANGFAMTPRTFKAISHDANRGTRITVAATGRVETNPFTP